MGCLDILLPIVLGEAEIRVLSPASATAVRVGFILKTFKLTKTNEYFAMSVPGLNGEPLQFAHGRARTLSMVLAFDGRATNTDVRQPMAQVRALMNVDRDRHAPPLLAVEWQGESFQCVLASAVEEFRSVFTDGRPSRGRMRVVFRESRSLAQLQQEANLQ